MRLENEGFYKCSEYHEMYNEETGCQNLIWLYSRFIFVYFRDCNSFEIEIANFPYTNEWRKSISELNIEASPDENRGASPIQHFVTQMKPCSPFCKIQDFTWREFIWK